MSEIWMTAENVGEATPRDEPRRPVPQWTVQAPHDPALHTFEDAHLAWTFAAGAASSTEPAVVTHPEGVQFYVFAASQMVEVSTRHLVVGTTRRLVDAWKPVRPC